MSTDSNAVVTPYRRYQGLMFGLVLGAAIAAIVMGFLWSSDSVRQEDTIKELSAQNSEKDATIGTLTAQLRERDKGSESSKPGNKPSAGQP